jgi:peptide/nickel transport system permease protein
MMARVQRLLDRAGRFRPARHAAERPARKAMLPVPLRRAGLSGGVVLVYFLVALLAPVLAPHGEAEVVGAPFSPWSAEHWLGTDQLGRDFLSRLIYGLRNSLTLAVITTLLSFLAGTGLGLLAAAGGRIADVILSRLVDVMMSLPALIFALMVLAVTGTGAVQLVLVIAALDSTRVFRLARALGQREATLEYVEAARLRGEGILWIVLREILPNIRTPLLAEAGMRFTFVFLTMATLSFLGLGLQPPAADLGAMVRENAALISYGDFTPLIPAAVIAGLAIAVNFLIDNLETGS